MTAQPVGWVVLTNDVKDGDPQWQPDWDGIVHTDQERAETELATCRAEGHQCLPAVVMRSDDEDLAHRAIADTGGILSVRPPSWPTAEDVYAAELRDCLDFTVTREHLLLLGRLNWRWNGALDEHWWGGAAVSQRRPYGNEDMFRDIAELLTDPADWEETVGDDYEAYRAANEPRFRRLHTEMFLVLEILCSTGQNRSGRWTRASVLHPWQPAPPKEHGPDEPLTDVPMVCIDCRKPVSHNGSVWVHKRRGDAYVCRMTRQSVIVKAMVAAGNENVPR